MDTKVYANKAGATRSVSTQADLVRARFDGFTKELGSEGAKADRKALQERAKNAGIPANQSNAELEKALADLETDYDVPAGHRAAAGDNNPAPVDSPVG